MQREVMELRASEAKLPEVRRWALPDTVDRLAKALPERDEAARIGGDPPLAMAAESYRIVTHPAVGYCVRTDSGGLPL